MKRLQSCILLIIILITSCFWILYTLWGVTRVPFHPDESSWLFMSSDFNALMTAPTTLVWTLNQENDLKQLYRELNAPITKYLLGLGRSLAGLPALSNDWDWSKSWEENRQAGALPSSTLLQIARLSISFLFPFCLFFMYRIGKTIEGSITGCLAVLLLGTNALILLHTRRAMAEGALTLGVIFAMWSFLQGDQHPWLAGIGMALAFNAKQSTIALFPAGLLAVSWLPDITAKRLAKLFLGMAQYLGVFVLITFALNPLYWRNPMQALRASWSARQDLLQLQVDNLNRLAPEQVLNTPAKRILVMVANLFILPPSFSEVGNYQTETAPAEKNYLNTLGNNLMRGLIAGSILLSLTISGLAIGVLHALRTDTNKRRNLTLLLLATALQVMVLILSVPLPWQRYVIPVVPFVCLWSSYLLGQMIRQRPQRLSEKAY
jgi:hypothetical protein